MPETGILELNRYLNSYSVAAGGFGIELRLKFITFLGNGYLLSHLSKLESLKDVENLPPLPAYFFPVTTKRTFKKKVLPILRKDNKFRLEEGVRNQTLKVKMDMDEITLSLRFINDHFCEPSLPESELAQIVQSIGNFYIFYIFYICDFICIFYTSDIPYTVDVYYTLYISDTLYTELYFLFKGDPSPVLEGMRVVQKMWAM